MQKAQNIQSNNTGHLKLFIEGIVQGVGFRPHVYNMAKSFGLAGYVLNDSRGVTIEVEAEKDTLCRFRDHLSANPPGLSDIQNISEEMSDELQGYTDFVIRKSRDVGAKTVLISPDIATCEDCIREMNDPADPRYKYPFINCTNCGPRLTIITDVPYDRKNTSMAGFPMCDYCRGQYEDPSDRRFHAQPVACPVCGPHITLLDNRGNVVTEDSDKVISSAVDILKKGGIIAIKGLGGYHLAVDAKNETAVSTLRKRKYREDKPFAIMAPDINSVRKICKFSMEEEKTLKFYRSPIVVLKNLPENDMAKSIAPNNDYLGVMLPYTPLHHLIMNEFKSLLVMTSGNVSEEPISYIDEEAKGRLSHIADYFLIHNRPIHTRCDDTVMRVFKGNEYPLRRSRGYVPFPVILKHTSSVPVLAVGAELKNTFCLYRGNHAFVSHHIGDLENIETMQSFEEGIKHYRKLFDITPQVIACDAHPRYLSTQYALDSPIEIKVQVQHHHAHIVSCMADNEIDGDVIGVALDGVGYGSDGKLWGCEFMIANRESFTRRIRLKYMKLAGAEKAIKEPWRSAFAYLYDIYGDDIFDLNLHFLSKVDKLKVEFIRKMIDKGIGCPEISSAGRLFDAVSALIGIRSVCNFEGQAAIEMEMMADEDETGEYEVDFYHENTKDAKVNKNFVIDPAPIFSGIIDDLKNNVSQLKIAGRFHNTMARVILLGAEIISKETGIKRVALSGGVFQNMILLKKSLYLLEDEGFDTYIHKRVPTNDGGISLGQAVIAAKMFEKR
ncbi:MAG: carbamoyltransferase HypF [Candidatus Eremiobacteraeota bacterium]|nr:carbamoyltransferase HypF [Candidatus Eremiobacteraeota bacterium]